MGLSDLVLENGDGQAWRIERGGRVSVWLGGVLSNTSMSLVAIDGVSVVKANRMVNMIGSA